MRVAIGERIADHAKDGGAVVLVTHDPQLLLATASTCLVIDEEVREFDPEQGASIIAGS
jgi:ABC-2 type transport system ATP-binding protein